MFKNCKLVHADLSEYNILYHDHNIFIIDVAQAVEDDHPNAIYFLKRDCNNINNFFARNGVDVITNQQLFEIVTFFDLNKNLEEVLTDFRESNKEKVKENSKFIETENNNFNDFLIPRTLKEEEIHIDKIVKNEGIKNFVEKMVGIGGDKEEESEDEMELEPAKPAEEKAESAKAEKESAKGEEKMEEESQKKDESKGEKDQKGKRSKKEKTPRAKKNPIERELECQTCRGLLKDPITLPCQSHSICSSCSEELLQTSKKNSDGTNDFMCPSCGKKGGVIKVKDVKELKPNRELERVMHAYDSEKQEWMKEKEKLQRELEELRKKSSGGGKDEQKNKGSDDKITEEHSLSQNIQQADAEKLKEVAEQAFYKLKNEGENLDELMKEFQGKEKKELTIEKGGKSRQKKKGKAKGGKKTGGKGKKEGDEGKDEEMAERGRKGALAKKENNQSGKKSAEKEQTTPKKEAKGVCA